MKLIFAGTPEVAVPALNHLAKSSHEIVAVITREDAPLGRKRVMTPSPVAQAAEAAGFPVLKANRLDADLAKHPLVESADLGVIVAYGGLVREPLLSAPTHGWINLHFSLLPAWRGAAPVQHSLLAGDATTGLSVFQLVAELDAGDIFAGERYEIPSDATAGDLLTELAELGSSVLGDVVDAIDAGTAMARPQSGNATFAPKLSQVDGRLDLTEDADAVYNRFRAVSPEPGAHVELDGVRLKIHRARLSTHRVTPGAVETRDKVVLLGTATTALELVTVQPAGKKAMPALDWWRGHSTSRAIGDRHE